MCRERVYVGEERLHEAQQLINKLTASPNDPSEAEISFILSSLTTSIACGVGEAGYILACLYRTGKLVSADEGMVAEYIKASACAVKPSSKGLRLYGISLHRSGHIEEAKALLTRSAYLGCSDAALDLAAISADKLSGVCGVLRALESVSQISVIDQENDLKVHNQILAKHSLIDREALH
jgi:hypothetical protein